MRSLFDSLYRSLDRIEDIFFPDELEQPRPAAKLAHGQVQLGHHHGDAAGLQIFD